LIHSITRQLEGMPLVLLRVVVSACCLHYHVLP